MSHSLGQDTVVEVTANMSVISCLSVLLLVETGVFRETHKISLYHLGPVLAVIIVVYFYVSIQSMAITTKGVSLIQTHREVNLIQQYAIKIVSDL
jgi:hypothetical protein